MWLADSENDSEATDGPICKDPVPWDKFNFSSERPNHNGTEN